jgi:hypothetical protein
MRLEHMAISSALLRSSQARIEGGSAISWQAAFKVTRKDMQDLRDKL